MNTLQFPHRLIALLLHTLQMKVLLGYVNSGKWEKYTGLTKIKKKIYIYILNKWSLMAMSIPLLPLRMSYKISTPMYEWDFKYNVQTQHTHNFEYNAHKAWYHHLRKQDLSPELQRYYNFWWQKKIFCLRTFPAVVSLRLKLLFFFVRGIFWEH